MKKMTKVMNTMIAAVLIVTAGTGTLRAEEQPLRDRMLHHRCIDALVWAMPLLNFKQYREGHKALGVGCNTRISDAPSLRSFHVATPIAVQAGWASVRVEYACGPAASVYTIYDRGLQHPLDL